MFFDEGIKFIHDDKLLIFYKKRPFQYAIIPHTVRSELVVRVSPTPPEFLLTKYGLHILLCYYLFFVHTLSTHTTLLYAIHIFILTSFLNGI